MDYFSENFFFKDIQHNSVLFMWSSSCFKDQGSNHLSGTASLVIKVLDIQDSQPYFDGLPYIIDVNESLPINTVSKNY